MRPTTLFSNHDEIARAADVPTEEMVTRAEEPVRSVSIGSRAFSMFNELPDDALRASRGFHMSAKLFVAVAAAATFGVYVIAREAKQPAPVVVEQPAQVEQAPSELAPIAPEPAADPIAIAPDVNTAPAVTAPEPAPVAKRTPTVVKSKKTAANPWDMPAPAAATILVAPAATPVAAPAPVERAPEAPVAPTPVPEAPAPPAPVVEAPAQPAPPPELPGAPTPAPVVPAPVAPVPPPANPAAPTPAPAPAN